MSDQRIFKKEGEFENLNYFIEAYYYATEANLEISCSSERPDFICIDPNNSEIGIELVKITRGDPEQILWDRILVRKDYMLPENAIEMIQRVALLKDEKKSKGDWECPDNTILLIELVDIPLFEIMMLLENKTNLPDIDNLSFVEIWLGDYTGIEPYDNIELFCLFPDKLRGYFSRQNPMQKPYG